jgi:hypothetical protein
MLTGRRGSHLEFNRYFRSKNRKAGINLRLWSLSFWCLKLKYKNAIKYILFFNYYIIMKPNIFQPQMPAFRGVE